MDNEQIVRPLELRAENNRRLEGIVLSYGEVSPSHRERFLPSAFDLTEDRTRWLDYRHDPTRVLAYEGAGLTLENTPEALTMRAELPSLPLAEKALEEVRDGKLAGLSIEFLAHSESRDGDIRVVEKATLAGIGLVSSPSYELSRVEARNAGISSTIPFGSRLGCSCYQGSGNCHTVVIEPEAVNLPPEDEDLLAIWKGFGSPLASRSKGTLRVKQTSKGLEVDIDLPETSYAEDLIASSETSPVLIRPLFDAADVVAEEIEEGGELVAYLKENMFVKAILVGGAPAPQNKGWPEADVKGNRRRREAREYLKWL